LKIESSRKQGIRTRLLVVLTIVCGSVSAVMFWSGSHSKKASVSEEQARAMGFSSASDFDIYNASAIKLYNDQFSKQGLDPADFEFVTRMLSSDSKSAVQTLTNLTHLTYVDQQVRVVKCLSSNPVTTNTREAWILLLKGWASHDSKNKTLITRFTDCDNKSIALLAQEIENDSNRKQN